jgi:heptosyltransferase I
VIEVAELGILMMSALGDAVHVLPVVTALKRAWPRTRITWIIQPMPHRLVAGHPAVDDFVVFQRRQGLKGVASFVETGRVLHRRRFDVSSTCRCT